MASVPDSDPPVFAISADDLTDWTPFFNHKEIQIDVKLDTDAQAQFGPSTTLTPLKCINNFFWGWNFASTSNKDATRLDHDQNVAGFGDSTMMRLSEKATALSDDKFKKSILDLIQVSAPGAVEVDIDTTPSTASTAATTTAPPTTNDTGTTAATGTAATSTGTASTTSTGTAATNNGSTAAATNADSSTSNGTASNTTTGTASTATTGTAANTTTGTTTTTSTSATPTVFDAIVAAITGVSFTVDTSEDRNAMWITGGNVLRIDTSLSFAPVIGNQTNPVTNIQKAISDLFGVTIDNLKLKSFTIKRTSRCVQVESYDYKNPNVFNTDYVVSTSRTLTFEISISKFILWVGLEPHGVQIAITPESGYIPTDGALQTILPSTLDLDALKPPDDFFSAIKFLRLRIGVDLDDGFTWTVTFSVTLKKATGPEDDDVQIYLEYDSYIETLSGGLILAGFYATKEDYFNPNYDPFQFIELPGGTNPPLENWDLRRYFPNPHSVPTNIPLAISDASISINFQDDPIFIFTGSAGAPGTDITGAEVIPSPFVWDEVGVFFQISKSYFEGGFYSSFILNPPTGTTKYDPAELGVLVDYNTSSGWLLRAQLSSLSCGLIYSFFEDSSKDDLLGVLGDLTIANLNILFTYDSTGSAASFLISGAIQLDELELRLFYQYTSSKAGDNAVVAQSLKDQGYVDEKGSPKLLQPPKQSDPKHATTAWIFECDLGASTGNATIGSIANAFMADAAASLPSFVSDIKIPLADGSNGRAPVYLKTMNDGKGKILFALRVAIGIFSLTFVQVGGGSSPKRLVRFAADTIPIKDGIPLIDKLPQIFDELDYVWVNEAGGFLKSDVDAINNEGLLGNDILMYKVSTKTSPSKDQPARPAGASTAATANSDPVVITPGHHFVVISGGVVVLDHNFSASPSPMAALPKSTNPSSTVLSSSVPATATTATATTATVTATTAAPAAAPSSQQVAPVPATSPTKNDILFSLGPLSISAMGLQFKEEGGKQCIILTFDATFAMGPLSFTLLGFGLTVNLKGITLDNLQNCLKNTDVALAGMALSFNKPPILIAGGFEHQIIQALGITQDVYLGGVAVSFPPYTFNGLGEYAVVTNADSSQYRSIFVYAKLDGPLITLELATISGIRLGFGFNSFVRAPAIDDIVNFPFINDHSISTTGNDPMAILKAMTVGNPAWVTPKLDSYWLAVGMSIQAFDVITATAVAVFEFGDAGLAVDIYADAVAQMPPEAPKAATVVYVEVGMKIEMNFADGYFAVAAMLAPTSFLLVPQCHLTGGLALSYWFPPNENAGDWVFTIGGYHRSYQPPSHYPVVPRLGISFQVDILSITGESYFAITPKCVMAGALIHASLSFGPITAWLDAAFDALINFHPFHYDVEFSISVGVAFNLDFLFIHIHISVTIGADLHIQGPEFGGTAHVDFYLFSFDVNFGAPALPPPPLDLLQFWLSLHKPGPTSNAQVHESNIATGWTINFTPQDPSSGTTTSGAAFKFILEDGNAPQPKQLDSSGQIQPENTHDGVQWSVKGGTFKFRIATDFAMTNATIARSQNTIANLQAEADAAAKVAGRDSSPVSPVQDLVPSPSPLYAKPMHVGASSSSKITSTLAITITDATSGAIIDHWGSASMVAKDVPTAIWAGYDAASDPRTRPPELLNGDNPTVSQTMAIAITAPLPELCPPPSWPGFIPKFKPTAVANFEIRDFRVDGGKGREWFVPKSGERQTLYLPRVMSDEEKKQTAQAAWGGMKTMWAGLKEKDELVNDPGTGLVAAFASGLGWGGGSGTAAPKTSPVRKLLGRLPSKLIQNLDNTYLALPRIAVVG